MSYICVCVCVCVLLCVWFFTREGDWSLKCSELPPLSNNPLSGGRDQRPMFSCPSDGELKRPCA